MFSRFGAIALSLALLGTPLVGDEPSLAPRAAALLLRNGHVIQGNITRAGDFYVLTMGKTGEIRLPAADVESLCVDLEDAYRYQAAMLSAMGFAPTHPLEAAMVVNLAPGAYTAIVYGQNNSTGIGIVEFYPQ